MKIDTSTYKVSEKSYIKNTVDKTQIVIGSSLRKNNHRMLRLQHKDYGEYKKWNTYTISRDGLIYQHFDDKYYSDFLGSKYSDKRSVSIVLENMGSLIHTKKGGYVNWINETCDSNNVKEFKYLGYTHWESFPEVQLNSLVELCDMLCNKYNIPKKAVEFKYCHPDIYKFNGIVNIGNYVVDGNDMTPLLDLSKIVLELNK